MADSYDKSTKLSIGVEDLIQAQFKKTSNEAIASRVANEPTDPLYTTPVPNTETVSVIEFDEALAVPAAVETTILSYTVGVGETLFLDGIEVSGENIAEYTVYIAATKRQVKRTWWADFNASFKFEGSKIAAGTVIEVKVEHNSNMVGNFEATLLGSL